MRTLTEHLTQYAAYHQDKRNVATHFVGIPLIVVAVATLLSHPQLVLFGVPASALLVAWFGIFYFLLDLRFGLAMAVQLAVFFACGQWLATQGPTTWWLGGVGLFVVGWVIQFVGHYFEGKKPAFVDDLVGLMVGPLFLTAEAAFYLGLRQDLHTEILRRLGGQASGARLGAAA
jgi:uncharacterized membrane protein YGL010W